MAKSEIDRQVENESIFREINEDIQHWAQRDENGKPIYEVAPIPFYCECSLRGCKEKITITPALYEEIHILRRQFILKPDHETPAIEKVVEEYPRYIVVEKINEVPDAPEGSMRIV